MDMEVFLRFYKTPKRMFQLHSSITLKNKPLRLSSIDLCTSMCPVFLLAFPRGQSSFSLFGFIIFIFSLPLLLNAKFGIRTQFLHIQNITLQTNVGLTYFSSLFGKKDLQDRMQLGLQAVTSQILAGGFEPEMLNFVVDTQILLVSVECSMIAQSDIGVTYQATRLCMFASNV